MALAVPLVTIIYDAIIVLSGGITEDGTLPQPWVQSRLDGAAIYLRESPHAYAILNSRATPHKPPPLTVHGTPVDEAVVSAEYLVKSHQLDPKRILLDTWSYDTIGNAYFALLNHCIPRQFKNVLVITSEFHMPRTRIIFDHMFGLYKNPLYFTNEGESEERQIDVSSQDVISVSYFQTEDTGLDPDALTAREAKEHAAIADYLENRASRITNLQQLSEFVFSEHNAYTYANMHRLPKPKDPSDHSLLRSY